jgi:hypothetical protein
MNVSQCSSMQSWRYCSRRLDQLRCRS